VKLLLDDRYAPITSRMGFIEADCVRAAGEFYRWHREIFESSTCSIKRRDVAGPLSIAIESLLPLTIAPITRHIFIPTASRWTAYLNNSRLGTDASGPTSVLALRLKCRGLRISAIPDSLGTGTRHDKTPRGRYGSSMFELFGPESVASSNTIRSVQAMNEGRWWFGAFGTPQPFEEPETYKARRIRDRFPFELLDRYCRALGLRPFDEDFYLPQDQPAATLIERVGTPDPRLREFTLAEVQAELGVVPVRPPSSPAVGRIES
jgi:hypothetical protein